MRDGTMKFEILYIFGDKRPVTVFAKQLETGDVSLSDSPMLGGVPIKRQVSQPRALRPDGEPDLTQFAFVLASANDLSRLQKSQIVELT